MMKWNKFKWNKYFLMSMFISSLFIFLVIGIEVAEYKMRSTIIDDDVPFFEYNFLSNQKFINFIFMGNFIRINFNF